MILYRTIAEEACAEQEINRSKFIAHAAPVSDRGEAEEYIDAIRARFSDATHNVPAMVIGDQKQIQWASDDGEPQGTSGAPVVQMLVKEDITNIVVMVTRYFGGIKLGTGGLIRAYSGCAKAAVEKAGIHEVRSMYVLTAEIEYSFLAKLQNLSKKGLFKMEELSYTDKVVCRMMCEEEEKNRLKATVTDLTSGSEKILGEEIKSA